MPRVCCKWGLVYRCPEFVVKRGLPYGCPEFVVTRGPVDRYPEFGVKRDRYPVFGVKRAGTQCLVFRAIDRFCMKKDSTRVSCLER